MKEDDVIDLAACWWTIPAGVGKNKLAHRVPLSPSVVALLLPLPLKEDPDVAATPADVLAGTNLSSGRTRFEVVIDWDPLG